MPLILSDQDLAPLLQDPASMDGAIDAVERATLAYRRGDVRDAAINDRTTAAEPNIVQLTWAAHDAAVTGFQLFAELDDGPEEPNGRFVVLLDKDTRGLTAIVDYHSISSLRVGASSGAAARYLAPENAKVAGIIGSSRQARGQLQAIVRTAPGVREAHVFSPNPDHRAAFAREMSDWLGLPVRDVDSAEGAVRDADMIAIAANTRSTVLEKEWVKPGALVLSIGGGRLPASILGDWRCVFTTWEQTAARQPYADAIKAGSFSQQDIAAELAAVVLKEVDVRRRPDETVVFECGRMNYWAVAVAHWAYEWALKDGLVRGEITQARAVGDRLDRRLAGPGFGGVWLVHRPDVLAIELPRHHECYEPHLPRRQKPINPQVIGKAGVQDR